MLLRPGLCITDMKTREAFLRLEILQQILGVGWHQPITNSEILSDAGVGPLAEHITASTQQFLATSHDGLTMALCCQIDTSLGRLLGNTWKRCPGRSRNRWLDLVQ